jgi:imidazolonepropionase-like amidohydrolase
MIAITHVTLIDGSGAPPRKDMTVVVANGRVAGVTPAPEAIVPANAVTVDGTGRFLIPGLWDMHVHCGDYEHGRKSLALFVANGITGVRDMGSSLEDILRLRAESNDGKILAPRIVAAGPLLETTLPASMASNPMLMSAGTSMEARSAVDKLKSLGVDFIKVHDSVSREGYFEIARESKRLGIPFAGHVPPFVTAKEASAAGQRSIEHFGGHYRAVLIACSRRSVELERAAASLLRGSIERVKHGQAPDEIGPFRLGFTKPLLESFDSGRATEIIALFRRNRTWQTPTLVALEHSWDSFGAELTSSEREVGRGLLQKNLELVRKMRRAQIGILAGTDLALAKADSRLSDELALLVRAGLTPSEALEAATRAPAEFLGRLDSLGTISQGKIADLILLDADPLEDVENTKKIDGVILDGRLISKDEIQAIRSGASPAAPRD